MKIGRSMILLLGIAMVAGACADTDEANPAGDDAAGAPIVAGACTEEEPDCIDTAATSEDDEPSVVVSGGGSSGLVVDGGLTVPEAIATDATGTLAVQGFLFGDDSGWRLCELLAESFPAQCGGASLPLGNFERSNIADLPDEELIGLQESQGVTWSDQYVLILGEIVDGTLMFDAAVTG